ncbi:MAG: fluoride efflux transporter FluC [Candidatus Nanopelagicales bacterium]
MTTVLLIAIGGALGALIRWKLAHFTNYEHMPIGTLMANVLGSFLVGLATALYADAFFDNQGVIGFLYPLIAVGLAGSISTMSAVALEMKNISRLKNAGTTFGYLAVSVGLGILALFLGIWLGTSQPIDL